MEQSGGESHAGVLGGRRDALSAPLDIQGDGGQALVGLPSVGWPGDGGRIPSSNELEGAIPSELFDVDRLEIIYIGNNTLTGPIPENYYEPDNLRELWIDGNLLTGTVPDVPNGKFEQLEELIFNKNLLTGDVPDSLCDLRDDADGKTVPSTSGGDGVARRGTRPPLQRKKGGGCTECEAGRAHRLWGGRSSLHDFWLLTWLDRSDAHEVPRAKRRREGKLTHRKKCVFLSASPL